MIRANRFARIALRIARATQVQTRCIVKGEAQKSPLFWRFSWGFLKERLFSRNSTRKPLNLLKSPIFTNAPCKSTCLYNAPNLHIVDTYILFSFELFSENDSRVTYKCFSGILFPKITLHVFVCDSKKHMEKLFRNYCLGKPHVGYMKQCFGNCYRNNFQLGCILSTPPCAKLAQENALRIFGGSLRAKLSLQQQRQKHEQQRSLEICEEHDSVRFG